MLILEMLILTMLAYLIWYQHSKSDKHHELLMEEVQMIRESVDEIRSGKAISEGKGLNPNLFDIPPELSAVVQDQQKQISNLNKQLNILRTSMDI